MALIDTHYQLCGYFDEFKSTIKQAGFTEASTKQFLERILEVDLRLLKIMMDSGACLDPQGASGQRGDLDVPISTNTD